ncbi:MAG: serine/threonine-protein kinase [Planctomycetota bacterium]|nr:serine/threonine-protein kinase [Planctomycetota bacterium]
MGSNAPPNVRQDAARLLQFAETRGNTFDAARLTPTALSPGSDVAAQIELSAGTQVGGYRILRLLGRGGFGEVYLAERQGPVTQRVALKLLRPGLEATGFADRFNFERRALARMHHEGVASLIEAGIVPSDSEGAGRPYFAMEYVDGLPIDEHCRQRGLSLKQRVELIAKVCDALHHAHARGVIHRDIKPSNILVRLDEATGEMVPKIIDFGIAKALALDEDSSGAETLAGQIVGTPQYMSPEQMAGDTGQVDTRTDVYSLGVVLYAVLTGRVPPPPRAPAEHQAQRRRDAFPRPSSVVVDNAHMVGVTPTALARALRPELDWIVLRCLHTDAGLRYPSAAELAADLRRYLSGEAVIARPPTIRYQVVSLARRHRSAAWTTALATVALVIAAVASTWQAVRATRAQREADTASAEAQRYAHNLEEAVRFFSRQTFDVNPSTAARIVKKSIEEELHAAIDSDELATKTNVEEAFSRVNFIDVTREILDELKITPAIRDGSSELANQPLLQAILGQRAAQTYYDRGQFLRAAEVQTRVVELNRQVYPRPHENRFNALLLLATIKLMQHEYEQASELFAEAHRDSVILNGPDHPSTLICLGNGAHMLDLAGKSTEAIPMHRQVLAGLSHHFQQVPIVDKHVADLVPLLYVKSRQVEGEVMLRDLVQKHRSKVGDAHPTTIMLERRFSRLLLQRGKVEEALASSLRALSASISFYGPQSSAVASARALTGSLLIRLRRWHEAEQHLSNALNVFANRMGVSHRDTLGVLHGLVVSLAAMGEYERTVGLLRQAIRARARLSRESTVRVYHSRLLGECLIAQGRFDEARTHLIEGAKGGGRNVPVPLGRALLWLEAREHLAAGEFASAAAMMTHVERSYRRDTLRGNALAGELHARSTEDLARAILASTPHAPGHASTFAPVGYATFLGSASVPAPWVSMPSSLAFIREHHHHAMAEALSLR